MRAVVIGIGCPDRRDDGFGPEVVRQLRERELPEVALVACDGELTTLIERWSGADLAVVVHAIRTRPPRPGRIHRLSASHPAASHASASGGGDLGRNGVGLPDAVALARAMDRMPGRLLLYAVGAGDVSYGEGLTVPVAAAADQVAAEIADLVGATVVG